MSILVLNALNDSWCLDPGCIHRFRYNDANNLTQICWHSTNTKLGDREYISGVIEKPVEVRAKLKSLGYKTLKIDGVYYTASGATIAAADLSFTEPQRHELERFASRNVPRAS